MVSRLTLYCDRCDLDERTVEGRAERLGIDGVWWEVHLCEQCRKELAEAPFTLVVTFFRDYGEAIDEAHVRTPLDGLMPCLWCDKTYTSVGGLDAHLKTRHQFTSPEDAWGPRCPACGSDSFIRMSTHASRTHHRHVSVLMVEAAQAGDPYGVVKDRQRAGRR